MDIQDAINRNLKEAEWYQERNALKAKQYRYANKQTLIDFYEKEHFNWRLQQYQEARNFLKNCGKPKDDYDRFLISEAKVTQAMFQEVGIAN